MSIGPETGEAVTSRLMADVSSELCPRSGIRKPGFPKAPQSSRFRRQSSGFALVSVLVLLVLLIVLAVGMLGLSAISLRATNQSAAMAEAQANARLAMIMAMGQLQEAMGPDTRVSARAELLAKDSRIGVAVPENTPRAWWVGASSSDPTENIDAPSGVAPAVWFVSGLDPQATPSEQIASAQPFADPVAMYDDHTIDTGSLTGGQPIEAGKVEIVNGRPGAMAYFIDDNGMKAQLAASRPEVRNDRPTPLGRGVLPGTYDIGILEDMAAAAGRTPEEISRLMSLGDLPFIGAGGAIAREKHFDYTTSSRGVLSNVKGGGLKKDLTIAFEKDAVFEAVFGNGGSGFPEEYIMMDPEKFNQSDDLQAHGYIHWEMLKDFYNTKRHIQTDSQGMEYLPISVFSDEGFTFTNKSTERDYSEFVFGRLGPHQFGDNAQVVSRHKQFPYGDYGRLENKNGEGFLVPVEYYKHSPVVPVLMRMQQNAWLERLDEADKTLVRTNVQMWMAQYNPYNIGLNNSGPFLKGYSGVDFKHMGLWLERDSGGVQQWMHRFIKGFLGRGQITVSGPVMLGPGRTHVYAFQTDTNNLTDSNKGYYHSGKFGDAVKDLTMERAYRDRELFPDQSHSDTLSLTFDMRGRMTHGGNSASWSTGGLGSDTRFWTVAQVFYAPYSWEKYASKTISFEDVGLDELNENNMARFSFQLRTTREPVSGAGPAIRPLADANVRALLLNPRWDSPLGLNAPAAYSADGQGEVHEQIMQMDVRDDPKGYAYWGAGRDPVDGYDRVILFDIPREDLVSLGQLQHANVGRFSYEPSYIVGSSYANLRIPQDQWKASVTDTFSQRMNTTPIAGAFNLYDASYLVNEVLWDGYIFTTIPQVADNRDPNSETEPDAAHFEALRKGEAFLANPRFLPYQPAGSSFDRETLHEVTTAGAEAGAFYHNAGHLMVDGAFNVNSTSVDAWEAFLSGTHQLPYQKIDGNGVVTGFATDVEGVRFPRVQTAIGGPMDKDDLDENFWTGFRSLSQEELRELAAAIVAEVKKRGPFLTFAEFVNRKLESGEQGQRGALQAALDATVNKNLDPNYVRDASHSDIPADSTQGTGFPGQLLQGDILQALSPYMTVRSDTFTVRAYGETRAPGDDGKVLARAWCEATVQRIPDPVANGASGNGPLVELIDPSSEFGRAFRITSFRWLSPDEI